ncbi:unnamed protein product [Chrysoparadoxa australica]
MKGKVNPADIKNKVKRSEVYRKQKQEKKAEKKLEKIRWERLRRAEARAGDVAPLGEGEGKELQQMAERRKQRTLENTREEEITLVSTQDSEVFRDEADDEFSAFFSNEATPKIMITTRPRPSSELFAFIGDLLGLLPNAFYYPRQTFTVQQICEWAGNKEFTHLFVLSEKARVCNGLVASVLPHGPTAFFKVSNVKLCSAIANHGTKTAHQPEIILNNFNTRLGHRVGRFLGSFFPHAPHFKGRQVVTFHNQRDYVFVRHHRYVFEEKTGSARKQEKQQGVKARLQELGPRFTLKMRWMQEGTFDTRFGEYEWIHKRKEMDTSRRKFHL